MGDTRLPTAIQTSKRALKLLYEELQEETTDGEAGTKPINQISPFLCRLKELLEWTEASLNDFVENVEEYEPKGKDNKEIKNGLEDEAGLWTETLEKGFKLKRKLGKMEVASGVQPTT